MQKEYVFPKIETNISSLLKSCLSDLGVSESPLIVIEIPKERANGDLSTNVAFRLSPVLKKKPKEIAELLLSSCRNKLGEFNLDSVVKDITIASGGFLNFYLKDSFLYEMALDIIKTKDVLGDINLGKGKNTLIEFVSANPTGPLSIAHARQAAVGDSLARILAVLGFKVTREYYNNDEGNQINILGKSLELRYRQLQGETVDFPEDHYQGDYIIDLAKEIKEKKIKIKDEQGFRDFALEKITKVIQDELGDFGVEFDVWYSQKKLASSKKIEQALDLLRKKDFIYENEGATWFKSTEFGDDKDRVVVKSDKNYTYLAPDIAYHLDKFNRGFKWLINIWGPDHHGYVPRIKAVIQALGHDKGSLSVIIVQLATIYREGKSVSMSTRRGQYITLREVLNEVGRDATRFFLLMRRTDSHLDFDLELAKKQSSENPVYYIQYAYARICSILNNAKDIKLNLKEINLSLLKEHEEGDLLQLIFQFSYVMEVCLRQLDSYPVTAYLQNLATAFHRFYDQHKVLSEDKNLTLARLALIRCLQIVFAQGLDLLGISKPEKM
ncbi:MAG: arginine--tRNA ligase [Candidatus Omnitrophica bacterium]|nr:arginine--tRNA ligase [Candidatus Omnitrophota bacterium]MDD5351993.1 arginine--tRNA ligase [Candidatus Omnitrophota bacterium]MDD5551047.1 arginine--tRNA ligase [Candidatus Omnitrophota bacterium]